MVDTERFLSVGSFPKMPQHLELGLSEARSLPWASHMDAEAPALGHPLLISLAHYQGTKLKQRSRDMDREAGSNMKHWSSSFVLYWL